MPDQQRAVQQRIRVGSGAPKCGSVKGGVQCQLPDGHRYHRHEAAVFGMVVFWPKDRTASVGVGPPREVGDRA